MSEIVIRARSRRHRSTVTTRANMACPRPKRIAIRPKVDRARVWFGSSWVFALPGSRTSCASRSTHGAVSRVC